jgi:hypothetical protein
LSVIGSRVETGAVTAVSRWIFDVAFARSPQSGLAWFCFLFPLIEPDKQISRIRLSEKTHGRLAEINHAAAIRRAILTPIRALALLHAA